MTINDKFSHLKQRVEIAFFNYHNDPSNRTMKRAIRTFLAGVFVLGVGINMFNHEQAQNKYASIESNYSNGIKQIDSVKNNDDVILVLHRTGCPACQKAESTIVSSTHDVEKANKDSKIVVMDLVHMNKAQTKKVADMVPNVLINGHIPSPSVVKLTKTDGKLVPVDAVVGDKNAEIKTLIESEK